MQKKYVYIIVGSVVGIILLSMLIKACSGPRNSIEEQLEGRPVPEVDLRFQNSQTQPFNNVPPENVEKRKTSLGYYEYKVKDDSSETDGSNE